MVTFFKIRNPTGKSVENLTLGLESAASMAVDSFFQNEANRYKQAEVVLMSEDVASDFRKYLEGRK